MPNRLTAAALLEVLEHGALLALPARALALLAAATGEPPATLAQWSIGARDGWLLALREQLFGPQLLCLARCPACGERLELDFAVADIRAPAEAPAGMLVHEDGAYQIRFRLPNSADLLALMPGDAELQLLARCLLETRHGDALVAATALPPEVCAALATAMARADPQADVRLALECPACRHAWSAAFDIAGYLWSELEAWGQRILRDVHTLASAYGWSEHAILALSPWRRDYYLRMVMA